MPAALQRLAALAVAFPAVLAPSAAVLLASAPAAGQEPALKLQRSLIGAPKPGAFPLPAFLWARRIDGVADGYTIAEGDVDLRRGSVSIRADWLRFDNEAEEVRARGGVEITTESHVVTGTALRYRTSDSTGEMEKPEFTLEPRTRAGYLPVTGRGRAERIEFDGAERFRVFDGMFTTCKPGDEDWFIKAEQLDLDFGREVGKAQWASLNFMGTSLVKLPSLEFPLNDQRKSGFLPPIVGTTGKSGGEITVPYYLNLAPNYDLTLFPRYMEKRGLQIGGEFRYLQSRYDGNVRFEYLDKDSVRGTSRSVLAIGHRYADGPWTGGLNLNKASDDDYFRDLSSRLSIVAQTHLPREGFLSYAGKWLGDGSWSATGRIQTFQTLQDVNRPVLDLYSRAPQIQLTASKPELGPFDFDANGEFVDFRHPTQVIGLRTRLRPALSMPLIGAGGFITPRLSLDSTIYNLDRVAPGVPETSRLTLPAFSTDAGLVFERQAAYFGRSFLQTIEPRAYYLFRPYRDQSRLPLFDTANADFNYAQIFSENTFSGGDRLADANQLTLALTSRLISPLNGQESLRATLGQRYYFRDQRVTLNATDAPRTVRSSDWLASLSGRVATHWTAEAATQYNARQDQTERLTVAARYNPELLKTLNLSYRYLKESVKQLDVSTQWPLGGGWYGLARTNYSIRDHRLVESLAGFEYNGGCWVVRTVVQRFAAAAGGVTSNSVFVQIELNGLSRLGTNPFEALRRNIPGYTRLNQTAPTGRTFDFEGN